MNKTTRKRLKDIRAAVGASDEHCISIEFYDLSPEGEEIRIRDPHLMAYEHPGKPVHRVVFVDSDGNGGPGPGALAREKRRQLAEGGL
jgi:hypothetical protein